MAQILSVCEKGKKQTLPAVYSAEDGAASRKVYACERRHIGQVARVCVLMREVERNNVVQVFVVESQC